MSVGQSFPPPFAMLSRMSSETSSQRFLLMETRIGGRFSGTWNDGSRLCGAILVARMQSSTMSAKRCWMPCREHLKSAG